MRTVYQIDVVSSLGKGGPVSVDLDFRGCGIRLDFSIGQEASDIVGKLRLAADEIERWLAPPESPLPPESFGAGVHRALDDAMVKACGVMSKTLGNPGEKVVSLPISEGPTRAQQKAAWGFVAGTLRMAQANTRAGFDSRMLDAALVICQANERSL